MSKKINYKKLEEYRKERSKNCRKVADKTIKKLLKNKELVTFSSVAKESGLSRSYLYKDEYIKERIISFRNNQRQQTTVRIKTVDTNKDKVISCLYREIDNLKSKLDKKEKEISKLKEENNFFKILRYE